MFVTYPPIRPAGHGILPSSWAVTTLFDEPMLVIQQHVSSFNLEAHYTVCHPQGMPLANVDEQASAGKKVMRFLSKNNADNLRRTLHVTDVTNGAPLLSIDKSFAFAAPKTMVTAPDGRPLGQIDKDLHLGRPRFTLRDTAGTEVGRLQGNFSGWDFAIIDTTGNELAHISKKFDGIARQLLTDADTYVMRLRYNIQGPFRALLVSTAIAVDIVLFER